MSPPDRRDDDLPAFLLWERTVEGLLERTQRFPKAVRQTLTRRVEDRALDVLEGLVSARYAAGAQATGDVLRSVDDALSRLRVLLRLCHRRRLLGDGGYEALARDADTVGRMVGGWRRELQR